MNNKKTESGSPASTEKQEASVRTMQEWGQDLGKRDRKIRGVWLGAQIHNKVAADKKVSRQEFDKLVEKFLNSPCNGK